MPGGSSVLRTLLALGSVFALAACASSPRTEESAVPEASAATQVAAPSPAPAPAAATAAAVEPPRPDVVAQATAVPAKVDKSIAGGRTQTAAVTNARPKSADLPTPKQLVGLGRDQIQSMLGYPWLLKREGAAELWQYRVPACVLDIFLLGASSEELKVAYVDLRSRRENRPPTASCYADILSSPRPPTHQTAGASQ